MKKSRSVLLTTLTLIALTSCGGFGGGGGGGKPSPPPVLPSIAGAWDFTATGGNGEPIAVETFVTQTAVAPADTSANLSAVGQVGANGPQTGVIEYDIFGFTLSNATDMAVDYLGNTCGPDNGNRNLAGTIDESGHVTLTYDDGGSFTVSVTGTFNASSDPPFSGTFTVSAPGCKSDGLAGSITGVLHSSLTGTYSGTSAADSSETITMTLTDTFVNGTSSPGSNVTGTGTDSKTGNFQVDANNGFGNGFAMGFIGPGSPANSGSVWGYFDTQLGPKGSIMLVSFQGGSANSCPNGVPIDNGSCLIAILAMQ